MYVYLENLGERLRKERGQYSEERAWTVEGGRATLGNRLSVSEPAACLQPIALFRIFHFVGILLPESYTHTA